jgi:hypothetical protein
VGAGRGGRAGRERVRLRAVPVAFDELWVELVDGDTTLTRRGDGGVLLWHRGDARASATLAGALVALEKWLYDAADAGRDIAERGGRLLRGSGSVAIAEAAGVDGLPPGREQSRAQFAPEDPAPSKWSES